jgi:hypothetical protein
MRKIISGLALVAAIVVPAVAVSGCAAFTTAWQNLLQDPTAEVTSVEQTVNIILDGAQLAWTAIQPLLPADQAASINAVFAQAVADVTAALSALNTAVQIAEAEKTAAPNFSAQLAVLQTAAAKVIALVDQYKNGVPPATVVQQVTGSTPDSAKLTAARTALGSLHKLTLKAAVAAAQAAAKK